jgi:hypothetical protein
LTIRQPPVVSATNEVGVIEVDFRALMVARGKRNDPGACRLSQGRPEAYRQLKMAKMIRGELRLISASIAREGRSHDAGVVDDRVER